LHIDGSIGGGQVLRSSLTLSMLTRQPFTIDAIRAKRSRPGLMRQHLTAVQAAAQLCGAQTRGAELSSTALDFEPDRVRAGTYSFKVSGAGSACLVLQTVLPPLLLADGPSELTFEGGTHNPLAPPYPFLDEVFFPVIERMGPHIARRLERVGFAPAGGGKFHVRVEPVRALRPLQLLERGSLLSISAEAQIANLTHTIAQRELDVAAELLDLQSSALSLRTPQALGPGNVILLRAIHEHASELIAGFGERNVSAERVASEACAAMKIYLESQAPVGEHLADQLAIPFAMAGSGSFFTTGMSAHLASNLAVIERFLPVAFRASASPEHSKALRVDVLTR
jgi:RNA 3'-terminal phosphate cyclase (ATP)